MDQEYKNKAMKEMGVDEVIYNDLLECFLTEAREEVDQLDTAIKIDSFLEITRIGHGLKGMAGNLHITHIQEMAKALEVLAAQGKDKQALIQKAVALKQALEELK
ncbi:MAG: Hpt domain-containing protein [Candidatus Omnitrophota bacterium]